MSNEENNMHSSLYLSNFSERLNEEIDSRIQLIKDEIANLQRHIDMADELRMSDKNNNEGYWHKDAYIQRQEEYIKSLQKALQRTREEWQKEIIAEWKRWDSLSAKEQEKKFKEYGSSSIKPNNGVKRIENYSSEKDSVKIQFERNQQNNVEFGVGRLNQELRAYSNYGKDRICWSILVDKPIRREDMIMINRDELKARFRGYRTILNKGWNNWDSDRKEEYREARANLIYDLRELIILLWKINYGKFSGWHTFYREVYWIFCRVCLFDVLDISEGESARDREDKGFIKTLSLELVWQSIERWMFQFTFEGLLAEVKRSKFNLVTREEILSERDWIAYPKGWTVEQKREYKKENGIERKKHKERSDKGKERKKRKEKVSVTDKQRELIEKIVKWKRYHKESEKLSQREIGEIFQTSQSNISKVLTIIDQYHITYRNYNSILE